MPKFTRILGPWSRDAEKVVAVSAGSMFSLFLTDAGYVYSAGYAEYGQLGHGYTGKFHLFCSAFSAQAQARNQSRPTSRRLASKPILVRIPGNDESCTDE